MSPDWQDPCFQCPTTQAVITQELLEGMQAGDGRANHGSATSASPQSTSAQQHRRQLDQLQAAVRDLEADNRRLKEGLAAARPTTASAVTSNGARALADLLAIFERAFPGSSNLHTGHTTPPACLNCTGGIDL